MNEHNFKEGAEPDSVRLIRFVDSMPYMPREVAKLRFGIGDGYAYSIQEIASIFKTTKPNMVALLKKIRGLLRQEKLLDAAEESKLRASIRSHPPRDPDFDSGG